MKILDFQRVRRGSEKPMNMTIRWVSRTVLDRSETNPILTGEERGEEKSESGLRQIHEGKTREDKDTSQFEQHCEKN
jgi:hypothetical protein